LTDTISRTKGNSAAHRRRARVRRLTTLEKHSSEGPLLFLVAALFAIQKEIYLLPEIGGKGSRK